MGVQQVRRPVQCDRGLAGAGAALDDEHAARVGPDDPVLLALDGGDDVAHVAGALFGERGQQRSLARQRLPVRLVEVIGVQQVVVDADDLAAAQPQVTPPAQPLRRGRSGLVERLRRRRPPVHQHRVVLVVGEPDPADVVPLAAGQVDPPETQAVLRCRQRPQPRGVKGGQRIPLRTGLRRAAGHPAARRRRAPARCVPAARPAGHRTGRAAAAPPRSVCCDSPRRPFG